MALRPRQWLKNLLLFAGIIFAVLYTVSMTALRQTVGDAASDTGAWLTEDTGLVKFALALVLFSDAARVNVRSLRRDAGVPSRLLGIGLPLTVLAGLLAAGFVLTAVRPRLLPPNGRT